MKKGDPLVLARTALSLLDKLPQGRGCVVLVTSAVAREGKSFVSQRLALQLVQSSAAHVALLSTGMKSKSKGKDAPADEATDDRPNLLVHSQFPDAAQGKAVAPRVLHIPFGSSANRERLFRAGAVERSFDFLRERYRLTVIDGPVVADCGALLACSDATILVVDSKRTSPHVVRRELARAGVGSERVTGAILNHAPQGVPTWLGGD